jgi:hypothetical protein
LSEYLTYIKCFSEFAEKQTKKGSSEDYVQTAATPSQKLLAQGIASVLGH